MSDGVFAHEDCLMKHHVRVNGWLPVCKKRRQAINANAKAKNNRRLRYFTFCAVGAIDVLMLDVARVIRRSENKEFDTVFFFDKNPTYVLETRKRIPGANGFVGDFIETVLRDDLGNPYLAEESIESATEITNALSADRQEENTEETRQAQRMRAERIRFIDSFPFDVINLDLEEFLFKPNDPMPGKVLNALRRVFSWQRRPLAHSPRVRKPIDGFSLMFTTQVGPPSLSQDYLNELGKKLTDNLSNDLSLVEIFKARTGLDDVGALRAGDPPLFFKMAMPKVLVSTLMEEDWYADPEAGIVMYRFDRQWKGGSYSMLHLIMDVKRQVPPKDKRMAGAGSPVAQAAYTDVVRQVFRQEEELVTQSTIDQAALQSDLDRIKARRQLYLGAKGTSP